MNPDCIIRRDAEHKIVSALLAKIQIAGYIPFEVDYGDEVVEVVNADSTLKAVFAVDDCYVFFRHIEGLKTRRFWLRLVCGNGLDILSDYSCPVDPSIWADTLDAFDPEALFAHGEGGADA